ncbi:hypothetical protein MMC20_007063 [Loxospora ochrophaea]|nr:hypothetical protein [Loxospora ochrophaea]
MNNLEPDALDRSSKRPHSPSEAQENKRPRRRISEVKLESEPTEIDFATNLANPSSERSPHTDSQISPVAFHTPSSIPPPGLLTRETIRSPEDPDTDSTDVAEPSPAQNRWAQMRKNAAERAATQSEEQSRPPSQADRTDDSKTSGEETMESRVARIKARVAELTGNTQSSGPRR